MTAITPTNATIVLVDGARTPVGSFGGALAGLAAHELGGAAAAEAMTRSGVPPEDIREVVMGGIGQVGGDAFLARRVAVAAGVPVAVPAYTVNRLCGSGLQSLWSAAMEMRWNDLELTLAGGAESMSRMPFYDFDARGSSHRLGDRTLVDGTVMMLTDPLLGIHMGVTAERVAEKYGVSRGEQDEFAAESQRRAATEIARAAFAEEIVPVPVRGGRDIVAVDEHPRPGTTVESLGRLRPVFQAGGSVTAGNASGINDGGAAVVLATAQAAQERGLRPLVALEAVATAAMEPGLMGYAPVLALESLFARTGTRPSDIDVVELNEAFASQALAVIRDAGLHPATTNPYGGAIALGHPVGATGTILALRLAKHLARTDGELGIVTMCIGGGQALAGLFRRV